MCFERRIKILLYGVHVLHPAYIVFCLSPLAFLSLAFEPFLSLIYPLEACILFQ